MRCRLFSSTWGCTWQMSVTNVSCKSSTNVWQVSVWDYFKDFVKIMSLHVAVPVTTKFPGSRFHQIYVRTCLIPVSAVLYVYHPTFTRRGRFLVFWRSCQIKSINIFVGSCENLSNQILAAWRTKSTVNHIHCYLTNLPRLPPTHLRKWQAWHKLIVWTQCQLNTCCGNTLLLKTSSTPPPHPLGGDRWVSLEFFGTPWGCRRCGRRVEEKFGHFTHNIYRHWRQRNKKFDVFTIP